MLVFLKNLAERLPYPVGRQIARVPFRWRLGPRYTEIARQLQGEPPDARYVVEHFSRIFEYAKRELPFYREFYREHGVENLRIRSLEDIREVPVLRKERIRQHVDRFSGAVKLSSGGTSGEPWAFYLDKDAHAREWAHMHHIWGTKGYRYTKLKLTFRGLNLGSRHFLYNPVHHEFRMNTFVPVERYIDKLLQLVARHRIEFIYGYPSSVYIFLRELEACATEKQLEIFNEHVRCCLLASEFPVPYIADYIRQKWGLDFVSWYGHSEMCVLAHDEEGTNDYRPFHTYGYAEVEDGWLLGTSYHNFDMPLIRYDTHDHVEPSYGKDGLLASFAIQDGRAGDFVVDRHGKQLSLTGLVFARKHAVFDVADSVQVRQSRPGRIEFLITTSADLSADEALLLFDLENIDMDFSVEIVDRPVLTSLGKMPLKVDKHEHHRA